MLQIAVPENEIIDFCRRWQITELSFFGSVLREDFSSNSDVDVLVSFAPGARWSLFDLATMEYELEGILEREVDLVQRSAVEQAENYRCCDSVVRGQPAFPFLNRVAGVCGPAACR